MQRCTISLQDHLAQEFDAFMARTGHGNRSEAIRDLLLTHLGWYEVCSKVHTHRLASIP